jgi:hypothetical protein
VRRRAQWTGAPARHRRSASARRQLPRRP